MEEEDTRNLIRKDYSEDESKAPRDAPQDEAQSHSALGEWSGTLRRTINVLKRETMRRLKKGPSGQRGAILDSFSLVSCLLGRVEQDFGASASIWGRVQTQEKPQLIDHAPIGFFPATRRGDQKGTRGVGEAGDTSRRSACPGLKKGEGSGILPRPIVGTE